MKERLIGQIFAFQEQCTNHFGVSLSQLVFELGGLREHTVQVYQIVIAHYIASIHTDMDENNYTKVAVISAPGKVILCGEHAVVYGQDALAMAISLRCTATLYSKLSIVSQEPTIIFTGSLNCTIRASTLPTNIPQQYSQYTTTNSHKCESSGEQARIQYKIATFLQETGKKFSEVNKNTYLVQIKSQIPIGKCLGSSASFNTVLTSALFLIFGSHISSSSEADLHQVNRISKIMQKVEHGTPSGVDNFVAAFGGLVLFNNTRNPPFLSINDTIVLDKITNNLKIVLVDSGVEKNTKTAVSMVRKNYESEEKYRMMIKQIGAFAGTVLNLMKSEEENGWVTELLNIISQNHKLLRQLGVSIPKIEQIVSLNTEAGKRSAKITGSGMGGYVLVVEGTHNNEKMGAENNIITKIDRKGLIISYS